LCSSLTALITHVGFVAWNRQKGERLTSVLVQGGANDLATVIDIFANDH
jgi:hypothetical protein